MDKLIFPSKTFWKEHIFSDDSRKVLASESTWPKAAQDLVSIQ